VNLYLQICYHFTHVPECPVRKSGNKWHSVQGFALFRNPAKGDAMGVSPWSFTMIFVYFVSILAGILWGTTESINKNITEKQYSSFSYFLIQMSLNLLLYTIPFIMFGTIPRQPIVYPRYYPFKFLLKLIPPLSVRGGKGALLYH